MVADIPVRIRLIVFDCDGTLVEPISGGEFRKSPDDWQFIGNRLEVCHDLIKAGYKMSLASNRGDVAYNYASEEASKHSMHVIALAVGALDWHACFNHPKASIERYRKEDYDRKPNPGMLFKSMAYHFEYPATTLFVGDRPEDQFAAQHAGCIFMWANEFFQKDYE